MSSARGDVAGISGLAVVFLLAVPLGLAAGFVLGGPLDAAALSAVLALFITGTAAAALMRSTGLAIAGGLGLLFWFGFYAAHVLLGRI